MKIKVKGPSMNEVLIEIEGQITVEHLLKQYQGQLPYPVYGCKLDNSYRGLSHVITHDCEIEFLDIRNHAMWLVYQNSLVLLFIKAVHDILGKEVLVSVNNSINKGLYITIRANINKDIVNKIEEHMHELVTMDLPILKRHMSKQQAMDYAKSLKQEETVKLLANNPSLDNVEIYSLDDEVEIFYDFLVPSTGYLKYFELRTYHSGVLLRYPHQKAPLTIPEYEDQTLLYSAFGEANKWGQIMDVNYVTDLNSIICDNNTTEMIMMQEALHTKRLANIADEICNNHKRVVLICGPSSSGKTTFAKRLCIQLQVNGFKTLYLGTDDYFRGVDDDKCPRDENGEKDLECIGAVDTELFIGNLKQLLAGETVDLPRFDFFTNTKVFGERSTKLGKNDIIVIEGIHSLNRDLTIGIKEEEKYKIYISPFTPINIDHHNRISSTDCRLIRRLVRDYQFRAYPVTKTLGTWSNVRDGEEKNIFPFNGEADVFFNSNCIYEIAALKKYVEPLLKEVKRSEKEYAEAQRLLNFLRFFDTIENIEDIVNNSIIREFIGGSVVVR